MFAMKIVYYVANVIEFFVVNIISLLKYISKKSRALILTSSILVYNDRFVDFFSYLIILHHIIII